MEEEAAFRPCGTAARSTIFMLSVYVWLRRAGVRGGGGRGSVAPVPVWGEVRRSWLRAGPFQAKLGGRGALRRQSPPGPLQGSPPSEVRPNLFLYHLCLPAVPLPLPLPCCRLEFLWLRCWCSVTGNFRDWTHLLPGSCMTPSAHGLVAPHQGIGGVTMALLCLKTFLGSLALDIPLLCG